MDSEKEQVREVVISTSEKNLRLMSRYLSYVVICGLTWWVIHQDMLLQAVYKERDAEKQKGLEYWREAYRKSSETYLLMIQKQQDDAQRNLEQTERK